jgi:hypothetical protein
LLIEALLFCFDIRSTIPSSKEEPMSSTARRLTDALLAGDAQSAAALLAADATFHSPIRDYVGADRIGSVWLAVAGVVRNAQVTSLHERQGEAVAFFAGTIEDQPVDGVLRALADEEDRIADVTLLVRPWPALKAGLRDVTV